MFEVTYMSLADLTIGIKDGTHGTHSRVSKGVPFLSAKNIVNGQLVISDDDDHISERESQLVNRSFPLKVGDVLLTVVGSIGRTAIYQGETASFQRSVAFIRPDTSIVSSRYLYHAFNHINFTSQLIQRSNATAQAGIYLGELAKTKIPVFDPESHELISDILDLIDNQIRETETIIAKLQQLKQGLLHDLLTRGVDENGELRPSYEDAPELYKSSELGWIPKEWEVVPLETVSRVIDPQPDHRTPPESDNGVPYIGIGDFKSNGEIDSENCRRVIRKAYDKQRMRFEINDGDIIFGKIGTIGDPKVLYSDDVALSANVVLIQPTINSNFIYNATQSESFKKQIADITNTTSQPALGIQSIRLLNIMLPTKCEIELISKSLMSLVNKVEDESASFEKLKRKKSGLMDDLLTGKKRVTDLLNQQQAN